jgi:hypothetical protein
MELSSQMISRPALVMRTLLMIWTRIGESSESSYMYTEF